MARTASTTKNGRQTRSSTSTITTPIQSGQRALKQIEAASSREPLDPQASISQLSMAFIYYSVQLQNRALSKLETRLANLAETTPASNEHFAALQNEIDSLRSSKQDCDKLMVEHKDSLQQYANAKVDDLRAELEQATANATARTATNTADLEAMTLVQKSLDEKLQAQQRAIQELAKGDETAKRQDQLVQAIHKLLSKCSSVLEARTAGMINATPMRHCQRLQKEVATMQQLLLNTVETFDPSIKFPESIVSSKIRGRNKVNECVVEINLEHDKSRGLRAASSSSMASYISEPDPLRDTHMRQGNIYLNIYDRYRRTYRVQKPTSEKRFIRRFLSRLDDKQAKHTQNKLLRAFPDLVTQRDTPRLIGYSGVTEFIQLDKLSWLQVATVIASMTEDDFKVMAAGAGEV